MSERCQESIEGKAPCRTTPSGHKISEQLCSIFTCSNTSTLFDPSISQHHISNQVELHSNEDKYSYKNLTLKNITSSFLTGLEPKFLMLAAWCMLLDARCLLAAWCLNTCQTHPGSVFKHQASIRHQASSSKHQAASIKKLGSRLWQELKKSCFCNHLPLTTYHPLLTTSYALSATYYLMHTKSD